MKFREYFERAHKYILSPPGILKLQNNTKQEFRDALQYYLLNVKGFKNISEKLLREIEFEIMKNNPIEIDLEDPEIKKIIARKINEYQ